MFLRDLTYKLVIFSNLLLQKELLRKSTSSFKTKILELFGLSDGSTQLIFGFQRLVLRFLSSYCLDISSNDIVG
jgi:hypothetical protein